MAIFKPDGFDPSVWQNVQWISLLFRVSAQVMDDFDAYFLIALNRALAIVKDTHAAREIAQETMFRLWGKIEKGDRPRNIRAYVSQIARNLSYDHVNSRRRFPDVDAEEGFTQKGLNASPKEISLDELAIRRCLQERLTPNQYEVFLPRYEQQLESDQIAELLGKNRKTVQDLLSKAKRQAKPCLSGYQSDPQ